MTLVDAMLSLRSSFVDDVLARARSGPYLGEIPSVHGRPSIKLVGIGLSVSILPKSFHHFAFLGRVGVSDPAGVSKW